MASDPKSNARYNPLTRSFVPNVIAGESKTVAELDFLPGVYGFWLDEAPLSTASVTVKKGMTTYIVTNGGASGVVAPGEVYVDFSEMLGLCIFEDSEDGETFTIDYSGLGAPGNRESIQAIENAILATKLNIDGSNAMTGALNMGGNGISSLLESSSTNNAVSNARLETRLAGIVANVGFSEDQAYGSGSQSITLPSSGTWFFIITNAQIISVTNGIKITNVDGTFMGIISGSTIDFILANAVTVSTRAFKIA